MLCPARSPCTSDGDTGGAAVHAVTVSARAATASGHASAPSRASTSCPSHAPRRAATAPGSAATCRARSGVHGPRNANGRPRCGAIRGSVTSTAARSSRTPRSTAGSPSCGGCGPPGRKRCSTAAPGPAGTGSERAIGTVHGTRRSARAAASPSRRARRRGRCAAGSRSGAHRAAGAAPTSWARVIRRTPTSSSTSTRWNCPPSSTDAAAQSAVRSRRARAGSRPGRRCCRARWTSSSSLGAGGETTRPR